MEIVCKDYLEHECKTLNANCKWAGKRKCVRRDGVLNGRRFRYTPDGSVEEIQEQPELVKGIAALNLGLEFVYNPELDRSVKPLTRKMLGSGTYGITFIPAFTCTNGQNYPKSLGKVFYSQKSADDEWKTSMLLKKAEHRSQKYFSYPTERCEINLPKGNSKPEKELNNWLTTDKDRYQANLTILPQLIMEYSGMTLHEYFEKYYTVKRIGRSEFIKIFENLFYAVKQLQKHNLVHQDIKSPNIVISNTKRLRLIDFGLTVSTEDFYNPEINLLLTVPYHGIAPPEDYLFQLYNFEGVDYNKIVSWLPRNQDYFKYFVSPINAGASITRFITILKNIIKTSVDKLKISQRVTDVLKPSEIDPFFDEFLKNCINLGNFFKTEKRFSKQTLFDIMYYIERDLTNYWKENKFALKSDIYSIGSVMMSQADYLIESVNDDPQVVKLFKELMYGLLNPVPTDRIDINTAIDLVKQIKAFPSEDPFRKNKDPDEMKEIFMQFGKTNLSNKLKIVNSEIKYFRVI
jgi:serine/threonine protein kinase